MRPLLLSFALFLLSTLTVPAFTLDDLIAVHDAREEPYEIRSYPVDAAFRAEVAAGLSRVDPEIRSDILHAFETRFADVTVHVLTNTDTILISYIAALEQEGEIALMEFRSTIYFERAEIVERRLALFSAILEDYAPGRFGADWAESTAEATIDTMQAYADGDRTGQYPDWEYENRMGIQSLGLTLIPDWLALTVTSLDCPPRYGESGWATLFICSGAE